MTLLDDNAASTNSMTPEEYKDRLIQLESQKLQAVDLIKVRVMADLSTLAGFGIHAELTFQDSPNTVRVTKEVTKEVGDLSKIPPPITGAFCPICGKLFANAQLMGAHRRVTKACKVKK